MFFTTFRLNRLSQKGGLVVSESGGNHISYSMAADTGGKEYEQAGMRSAQEDFGLEAPRVLDSGRRVRRRHRPADPLRVPDLRAAADPQQPRGAPARAAGARRRPSWCGPASASTTDDEAMTERRLRQANLIGPAGYISMEDGAAPGFVQRGVNAARGRALGGGDGRPQHRVRRHPRHRSRGARLLDGLSRAYGALSSVAADPWTSSCSSRCRICSRATSQAIDDDRLEAWPDFFTEDVPLSRHHRGESRAGAAARPDLRHLARDAARPRALAARGQRLRGAALPPRDRPAGDRAGEGGSVRAQTNFMVVRIMHTGETMMFASGRYDDRVVLGGADGRDSPRRSSCSTAGRSTRCSRFRCSARGGVPSGRASLLPAGDTHSPRLASARPPPRTTP